MNFKKYSQRLRISTIFWSLPKMYFKFLESRPIFQAGQAEVFTFKYLTCKLVISIQSISWKL